MSLDDSAMISGGQQPDHSNHGANVTPRIPLPTMCEDNIEAYFYSLDFWFKASNISSEASKFNIVLASVPPAKLIELRAIIDVAPETGKYNYIRLKLIDHFTESQQRRLQRVLKDISLGDRKPSHLYNDMKRTAGSALSDSILHDLWVSRLPPYTQAALIAANVAISEKLKIADSITESLALKNGHIFEVGAANAQEDEISSLKLQIAALTKKMERLSSSSSHIRQRSRSSSRSRRPEPSYNSFCWYHAKFGAKATKCRQPCAYTQTNASNTSQ